MLSIISIKPVGVPCEAGICSSSCWGDAEQAKQAELALARVTEEVTQLRGETEKLHAALQVRSYVLTVSVLVRGVIKGTVSL